MSGEDTLFVQAYPSTSRDLPSRLCKLRGTSKTFEGTSETLRVEVRARCITNS